MASRRGLLGDETGQAMLIVLAVLVVLAVLPMIVFQQAATQLPLSVANQNRHAALVAAEAGVSDYMAHLQGDSSYISYNNVTGQAPPGNPAWNPPTGIPPALDATNWVAVPGSTASEDEKYSYYLDATQAATTGYFYVVSTGEAGRLEQARRTVKVGIRAKGFLNYAYATNTNTVDPQAYQCDSNVLFSFVQLFDPYLLTTLNPFYMDQGAGCLLSAQSGVESMASARCGYNSYQANESNLNTSEEGMPGDSFLDMFTGEGAGEGDIDGDGGYQTRYGPDTDDCLVNYVTSPGSTLHSNMLPSNAFNGPIFSNDSIYACSPNFTAPVYSGGDGPPAGGANQSQPGIASFNQCSGAATYSGDGSQHLGGVLPLPHASTLLPQMEQQAIDGGCVYRGPTSIVLSGNDMTVWSPGSWGISDGNGSNCPAGWGGTGQIPADGLVYVMGLNAGANTPPSGLPGYPDTQVSESAPPNGDSTATSTCSLSIPSAGLTGPAFNNPIQNSADLAGTVTTGQSPANLQSLHDNCLAGDALVSAPSGFGGKLTIVAANNVVITNNVYYACNPSGTGPVPANCPDSLGLVAQNYVLINHPVTPLNLVPGAVWSAVSVITTILSIVGWGLPWWVSALQTVLEDLSHVNTNDGNASGTSADWAPGDSSDVEIWGHVDPLFVYPFNTSCAGALWWTYAYLWPFSCTEYFWSDSWDGNDAEPYHDGDGAGIPVVSYNINCDGDEIYCFGPTQYCWNWWFSSGCVGFPGSQWDQPWADNQGDAWSDIATGEADQPVGHSSGCYGQADGDGDGVCIPNPFDLVQDWVNPETYYPSPGTSAWPGPVVVDAAIMALHHGFMLQNWGLGGNNSIGGEFYSLFGLSGGQLGQLVVNGSVAGNYAEPMGAQYGGSVLCNGGGLFGDMGVYCPSGFSSVKYNWDSALMYDPPPFWPSPANVPPGGNWSRVSFAEIPALPVG